MSQPTDPDPTPLARLSRRHALGGAAGVGLGLPLLTACGGDPASTDSAGTPADSPATPPGGSASGDTEEPGSSSFATTAEVPVGGGAVFPDEGLVVTQPTAGEFVGFSITCTHQGCPVESVTESGIVCPCHGSVFDLSSGEPAAGPASSPLGSVQLIIEGDAISRA